MRWAAILIATAVSAAAQCNYFFSPPEISIGPSQFSHTVNVFASPGCPWAVQSQAPDWIQIIIGGTGVGNGSFVVIIRENLSPEARSGTITTPGASLYIAQQGAACSYILSPPTARVGTAKGQSGFFINSRCTWTARSDVSWIRLNAPGSTGITTGQGNGAVIFDFDENVNTIARGGTITIAPGVVFRLTQDGTICDVTLQAPFINMQSVGGSASVNVASVCGWTARPDVSWIRLDESASPIFLQGNGNGTVKFSISSNASLNTRQGTITIGNKVFTIVQSGGTCSYSTSPAFVSFTANGGSETFRVNTPEGCNWNAIPNFDWVSVLPGSGNGPGTVTVTTVPNASGGERTAVITVQGSTVGVVQSPDPAPLVTGVVNAASLEPAPVSPGQIIYVRGERIGPMEEVQGIADLDTFIYRTEIAGARLYFDGVPVPLLSAQFGRIKAVAPYSLEGKTKVEVYAEYNGRRSESITVPVGIAAPGIFTLNESGRGPALARTEDYKFSDVDNPIPLGTEMILYLTGEGLSDPPSIDGRVIGDTLTKPLLAVRVFLGELQLETTYVGSTPGQVSGMLQVNAKVPYTAPTGNALPLTVYVGSYPAQGGVTVSVR
jgi:uncharacterized protein (TIGR03437 family)